MGGQFHVFFFPFMAQGHMIPLLDMAKLFASRGLKTTIVTTPLNAPVCTAGIRTTQNLGFDIAIHVLDLPKEGCELLNLLPYPDIILSFLKATDMLRQPLEQALRDARPDCLIADMFFPWTTHVAAKFGIPRLVFHGTSYFALCSLVNLSVYKPQNHAQSDSELFLIPDLPHDVKLTRTRIPEYQPDDTEMYINKLLAEVRETELTSYGVVVNSFYELEPAYADYYRTVLGRKAWSIGPLSLCNREVEEKMLRGKAGSIDKHEFLMSSWLDSKKRNSVIYVCFGSMANLSDSQLYEIAMGLEASGQHFIWAVRRGERKEQKEEHDDEKWLPEGFEERTKGKGLIIRGWAPQIVILDHEAVGGFVTHCGWNSILEGVCGGVPVATCPLFAEQFVNENLVTHILRIGVGVGAEELKMKGGVDVKRDDIARAVKEIMVGKEAEERRGRAKALREQAWKAVEEGGSSYSDLSALIRELSANCS